MTTGLAWGSKVAAGTGLMDVIWLTSKTYFLIQRIMRYIRHDLTSVLFFQLLDTTTSWQRGLCDFCQRDQWVESCELWHQKFLDMWTGRSVWLNISPKPEHIRVFILYKSILIDSNILHRNMKIYALIFNLNIWKMIWILYRNCTLSINKTWFLFHKYMLIYCLNYIHVTVFFPDCHLMALGG